MFGKTVAKVVVREPKSGDNALKNEQSSDDEKPAPAKKIETPAKEIITDEDIEDAAAVKAEVAQQSPTPKVHKKSADEFNHTDNVNMVMELFEGKLIE